MSNKPFVYQDPFPLKKDDTEYYLLSSDYVSVAEFAGQEVLKVEPQALTLLAQHAFHDASFMLRPAHQQQVADILNDPEASENDKYVALQFLRNSDIAAKGILPTCQDTGTAIITGKKGQRVWTGGGDEAALAQGCITPISRITCATRRTRRWICIKRSTPAPTCRRRSISMLPTATSTNSSASPRAAVRPTKPICTRKPKR
jgi:hypothetical protein